MAVGSVTGQLLGYRGSVTWHVPEESTMPRWIGVFVNVRIVSGEPVGATPTGPCLDPGLVEPHAALRTTRHVRLGRRSDR